MPLDELDPLIRRAITRELAEDSSVLEGLEARVVRRLARVPQRGFRLVRLRGTLGARPVRLQWAVSLGLAALALGIVIGRFSSPGARQALPAGGNTFTVAAPGASGVALVGDFSAWQPISLFDHDGDGVWTVTVSLPPGRYEYAFVVDGRWVGQDPLAQEYVRTFGEYVSVRYIGGEGL